MHICNLIYFIFNFGVVYMFRTRRFIFMQTAVCTEHPVLPTRLLIPMLVKHTVPYFYIQPSSWRWTFGFETCRRYQH